MAFDFRTETARPGSSPFKRLLHSRSDRSKCVNCVVIVRCYRVSLLVAGWLSNDAVQQTGKFATQQPAHSFIHSIQTVFPLLLQHAGSQQHHLRLIADRQQEFGLSHREAISSAQIIDEPSEQPSDK